MEKAHLPEGFEPPTSGLWGMYSIVCYYKVQQDPRSQPELSCLRLRGWVLAMKLNWIIQKIRGEMVGVVNKARPLTFLIFLLDAQRIECWLSVGWLTASTLSRQIAFSKARWPSFPLSLLARFPPNESCIKMMPAHLFIWPKTFLLPFCDFTYVRFKGCLSWS